MILFTERKTASKPTCTDFYQSEGVRKPFLQLWVFREPQEEPLSIHGDNMEQRRTLPGVPGLPELLQKLIGDQSKMSQKKTEQHLSSAGLTASLKVRGHDSTIGKRGWAKMASVGEFQGQNHF
ncbi:hypothetical protein ATANTOWER_022649 [Ataeniobius toweri]|uniref:Uncharacterized protein n=1 Tax=Ataeniobius toweri TaxID=208326 RepID=A0ABU7CKH2_9TELE|nr:hypothetical protein [Ataeniobius toweri]